MKINLDEISELTNEGYIYWKVHDELPLYLFNYTPVATYKRYWTPLVRMCRGLITDFDGNVVARPFKKFFNHNEPEAQEIDWKQSYTVFDKLDGSCGISYYFDGKWYLATRGSFTSEQAVKGTEILNTKYAYLLPLLDQEFTYLFEIIYPKNRVVLNYGDIEDVFLIGLVHKETGQEFPPRYLGFTIAETYDYSLEELVQMDNKEKEGFVIVFQNGDKIKYKFPTYVQRHYERFNLSHKVIWQMLSENREEELVQNLSDEVVEEVREIIKNFKDKFIEIFMSASAAVKELKLKYPIKKDFALYVKQNVSKEMQPLFFLFYDGKEIEEYIWELLTPGRNEFL